jgi:NhaP-type Na+/H+ or K+/H+ antiporter
MLLLVFALALFAGVLISCKARESILSVSVLFLIAGGIIGLGGWGVAKPNRELLYEVAELALFSVLFTDGMNTGGVKKVVSHWHLTGRALLLGMPLTIAAIAAIAHWLLGVRWAASFLAGAILSPTDPVFASSLFRFGAVPARVKSVLNLESGLNDGLALPAVLITLNMLSHQPQGLGKIIEEMLLGLAIGVVVPWAGIKLEQARVFGASGMYQRLNAFALGLIVLALSLATNANLFLAAFAAGITIATVSDSVRNAFHDFGELVTELLKLSALLIFGIRAAPVIFKAMPSTDYIFAALALFLVRPLVMVVSFLGAQVPRAEVLTIGWFGPKGFSSLVYALMALQVASPDAGHVARVSGLVIVASIVIYSSTDIFVGRWFEKRGAREEAEGKRQEAA